MGKVALPELRRLGYSPALSTGALAAGGTLGILIPPSVILIIFAILTEQNIAKLFLAAFVPGAMAIAPGTNAARNSFAMFCSVRMAKIMRITEGGINIPSVPPAASAPVLRAGE